MSDSKNLPFIIEIENLMDSEQDYILFEKNPTFRQNILIGEPYAKVLGFQIQAEKDVSKSLNELYINDYKIAYISYLSALQVDYSAINVEPYHLDNISSMKIVVAPKKKIKIVFILEDCDKHILRKHLRIIPMLEFDKK